MAEKIVKDSQGLAKDIVNDCISRKAAIEKATKDHDFFRGATTQTDKARRDELLNVICWLGELPSAQPEKRTEERTEKHACDCISRQAAIDAIFGRSHEIIKMRIGNLPSAQPEQRWIPCSERLPEEDHWLGGSGRQFSDNVLISILNSDDEDEWVDVSHTIDGEWVLELPRHCKILAWMPLPESYRG